MDTIIVHITGAMGVGKTCFASAMALALLNDGHTVATYEGGEETLLPPYLAERFVDPRHIQIFVGEGPLSPPNEGEDPCGPFFCFQTEAGEQTIDLRKVKGWTPYRSASGAQGEKDAVQTVCLRDGTCSQFVCLNADTFAAFKVAFATYYDGHIL